MNEADDQYTIAHALMMERFDVVGLIGGHFYQCQVGRVDKWASWPHGETWTLGDEGCVAALLEEVERNDGYDMVEAPYFLPDGK